ncbi:TraM recognition domain-containing protein [Haloferax sp. AB510]|uniref:TraM recognition domain-containing protein n=1 Tax=Haloferax sp. AB510 TaxID=2934172 RepID=UPI00209BDBD1|nr:TraM recognition domain-containing protein [Haloferax sp. AB510]MCO8268103.1 TraM recognition domain-containing protein [Haloferax sp. AB510]
MVTIQSTSMRSFVRLRPTTDSFDLATVTAQFTRLFDILSTTGDPPTLEWLLVTDGLPASTIDYTLSVDSDLGGAIDSWCRELVPDSFEVTTTTDPLARLSPAESDATPEAEALERYRPPRYRAVEFVGCPDRRDDWQTTLTPYDAFHETDTRPPLATVVSALANATVPMAVQVLVTPHADWRHHARDRRRRLTEGRDTLSQRLVDDWLTSTNTDANTADPAVNARLNALDDKDARRSFTVTARAVATTTDPDESLPELTALSTAFTPLSGDHYRIEGRERTGDDAHAVFEALRNRVAVAPDHTSLRTKLPWSDHASPALVMDGRELPAVCLLDASALPADAQRALAPTPADEHGLTRPARDRLERYRDPGLTLGHAQSADGEPEAEPISLPPSLQPLHVGWFGRTGSGKSTSLVTAMLDNHDATEGADILIDPKGDGMAADYLRAHYARHGSLENVTYFDCTETLPALSFFDIRDQLDAGIDRTTAVEDVVDHYVDILIGIMGRDRFEQAVRSPDIIRYVLKAMFDPVHGADAFTHREFQTAVARLHETRDPPPVVDDDLQAMLAGVAANSKRSFDELMQGVANRIEKVPLDARLAQLFNHVHAEDGTGPRFDLRTHIDDDAVIIIDTGGLRPASRRVITLVLLSSLWTALRRRTQQHPDGDHPLVNLYLEEAAELSTSSLLSKLLSQSRSFGLSMTLAMQFPAQLRAANPEAYREVLNNVSTIVTGNVAVDPEFSHRFATTDHPANEVQARLRALRRGQWLTTLPAGFGDAEPTPFVLQSAPLPAGHPEGPSPFSEARETAFAATCDLLEARSRDDHGLAVDGVASRTRTPQPTTPSTQSTNAPSESATAGTPEAATQPADEAEPWNAPIPEARVNSTLPYTSRLPPTVVYDPEAHAAKCEECSTRYDPSLTGLKNAIGCCHSLDEVDRDDIPISNISLTLTPEERRKSVFTDAQLRFLQAVYSAHQRRFDTAFEYDLLYDSMVRLQEYTGIDHASVRELVDRGTLALDCTYPHKLYTVTPKGRRAIGVRHREGVAYGHGRGDLSESSLHVVMVEVGRRYLEQAFVEDDDSAAVETVPYFEHEGSRLDAVCLDANGEIVVTLEAERVNNDLLTAVPEDFDKMAACDPEAAVWVVKNRSDAHEVLRGLNEPNEGPPRVEKTYSTNSPPKTFQIDQPGFSEMHTLQQLRDSTLEHS